MTLKGKIFMCLTFLFLGVGIGLVGGYRFAKATSNEGNQINVSVDGKVKDGSDVNINLEGNSQSQEQQKEDEASWWQFWK